MSRRMSCALTIDAVRDRSKTVTRRHVDTWRTLKPGDRLTLIEKGMGLPKGASQVVLVDVEVVDVRVEPILVVDEEEIDREGFRSDEWDTLGWAVWWATGHGYKVPRRHRAEHVATWVAQARQALDGIQCRRIEWRYLDEELTP